jgi:GTPase SAR1 family protein
VSVAGAGSLHPHPGRIVVVGPCASGKSTLVNALRARGYDAHVCGQEHSEIPTLWRHAHPDVVVSLAVDIAAVRRRRGESWPQWLHERQVARLADAAAAADIAVDTSEIDPETLVGTVVAYLKRHFRSV